jgi:hypothetical protein
MQVIFSPQPRTFHTHLALATEIRWDTDGVEVALPDRQFFCITIEEDDPPVETIVADLLSSIYGYCHDGFRLTVWEKSELQGEN